MPAEICEIINPSDQCTMRVTDRLAAAVACCLLGAGKYILRGGNDDDYICPAFLFGGSEAWFAEHHQTTIEKVLESSGPSVADHLDSVMLGSVAERKDVESAMRLMNEADARTWFAEHQDRRRTSLNNIVQRAKTMAAILRLPKEAPDAR